MFYFEKLTDSLSFTSDWYLKVLTNRSVAQLETTALEELMFSVFQAQLLHCLNTSSEN